MNAYIGPQFSGPVVQAVMDGIQASFDATDPLVQYWVDLDLSTAQGQELDFMGCLAGLPRPLVPSTFFAGTFEFGDSGSWPHFDPTKGFGDTGDPTVGGIFGSAASQPMPDADFRLAIPAAAVLKNYGLTIYSVDLLGHWTGQPYTISFDADHDIVLTFLSSITTQQLWVLQLLFDRYGSEPQVVIVNP